MTFKQSTCDTINGWGTVFRFITPILITVGLWIMADTKNEIREIRQTAKEVAIITTTYNTQHLAHHSTFEVGVCERLSSIETILKKR
jgi:hypothetical protein